MSEIAQRSQHHVAYHDYDNVSEHHASSWVGWIGFGGVVMILSGVLQAIAGLVGIFRSTFYVVGNNSNQLLVVHNTHTWGWVNLIVGLVVLLAGIALFSGSTWARVVAVLFAAGAIIVNMASMPLYPLWSILTIALAVLVIYAVIVHGSELEGER
jgi:hypothetical protein